MKICFEKNIKKNSGHFFHTQSKEFTKNHTLFIFSFSSLVLQNHAYFDRVH